jgi:hypothetical protein
MTEDIKKQVSEEPIKEGVLPQPVFSDKEPASSTSALTSEQIIEALRPIIRTEAERAAQSTKDKRFAKIDEREQQLLARLEASGTVIPPEIKQEFQVAETVRQTLADMGVAPVSDKSMSGAGANRTDNFNVVDALKKYGLTTNDVAAMQVVQDAGKGKFRNPEQLELALANVALLKLKPSIQSDSLTMPPTGETPKVETGLSEAEKEKKYAQLNEFYKAPTAHKAEIKVLEKELGM